MMKLKIKITKEVLEATKMCRVGGWKLPESETDLQSDNCAITYACRKVFPKCYTGLHDIIIKRDEIKIPLPEIAQIFILRFDCSTPEERVKMQPFEFEVKLTDEVINAINIEEVREVLKQSTTLELIN